MGLATIKAWAIHFYTALGLVCAFLAYVAMREGNQQGFFIWLAAAVLIDASDGVLARRYRVRELLPQFDGSKLDDITDYLTYVFLPMLAILEWGLLPSGAGWIVAFPMLASGYGFSQGNAKTEESFVGFPSYWNVVVYYLMVLEWPKFANAAILLGLSALVFWPIRYLYPTKAQWLRPLTIGLACLWGVLVLTALVGIPSAISKNLAMASLFFPAYYVLASVVHHRRVGGDNVAEALHR